MKIVITQCSSRKSDGFQRYAIDMYRGALYKARLNYIKEVVNPDRIYILSAKYGLIDQYTLIQPYDLNLMDCTEEYKMGLYKSAVDKAESLFSKTDEIIFIGGASYLKPLYTELKERGFNVSEQFRHDRNFAVTSHFYKSERLKIQNKEIKGKPVDLWGKDGYN